jgi:S1-C subfamily serine protease
VKDAVNDREFAKKTRYNKKESWKPVLAMAALGVVIAQLVFLGFYNVPEGISSGETLRPSDSGTPKTTEQDALGSANKNESGKGLTAEKPNVPSALVRGAGSPEAASLETASLEAKNHSSPKNGYTSGFSREEKLDDLLRFASVEISYQPDNARTEVTQGSGVIVAVNREGFEVLTACHVVRGKKNLSVVAFRDFGSGLERTEFQNVSILSCDEDSDLARLLVVTSDPPKRFVRIMLALSESVRTIPDNGLAAWGLSWTDDGFPVPKPCVIKSQKTAQRASGGRAVGYWMIDRPSVPGMSGGPLLDEDGLLIGIASGNSGGAGFYLDEFEISQFMKDKPSSTLR